MFAHTVGDAIYHLAGLLFFAFVLWLIFHD